jgi:hypothetical protein
MIRMTRTREAINVSRKVVETIRARCRKGGITSIVINSP